MKPCPTDVQRSRQIPHGCREIFLAGGCFWGAEAFLGRIRGVADTDVGYANGNTADPTYPQVCAGDTGFAETVRTVFDPAVLPLDALLLAYFGAIDPVAVNRQGHDIGAQYRTGIFYTDPADKPVIEAALAGLAARINAPVAVQCLPLVNYYLAEAYHQRYLYKNPHGYCHITPAQMRFAEGANR
jgi:peptide methionine sulfoxide reductase msrA/msrB